MSELINVGIGLVWGGAAGYLIGVAKARTEIRHYRDGIFVRDQLLDAAEWKLKKLTDRDDRGRFTGGKK